MEITTEHIGVDIKLRPASIDEDVMQNVRYILICIKEKNPLARDLGLDGITDTKGTNGNGYEAKVIEAIEKYEPRFKVNEVIMKYDDKGKWCVKVRGDIVVY